MVLMLRQVRAVSWSDAGRAGGRWVSTVRKDSFRFSEENGGRGQARKLHQECGPGNLCKSHCEPPRRRSNPGDRHGPFGASR